MNKLRLDQALVQKGLVATRSQAENYIKLGKIEVNGKILNKSSTLVDGNDELRILSQQYVSRAALKLASVADKLSLDFKDRVVLDVGSSTGGFTDYALKYGAKKVIAVDVGSEQLHPSLGQDERVELHEKTDIRQLNALSEVPDVVLIDVSFISLKEILPHIASLIDKNCRIIAMAKPQFETGGGQKHKGVVKNDAMRRRILKDLEDWLRTLFVIDDKADSAVAGTKGNLERFFSLRKKA